MPIPLPKPLSIAQMATEMALKAKKVKAPEIMKRVSKPIEQLRAEIREMKNKGQIVDSSTPYKPEFIRPSPKNSNNPAGISRRQWEKNQEYKHDIRPTHEFSEPTIISPESIEGQPLVLFGGDRTIGGKEIHAVNEEPLTEPSKQYAGASYPHEKDDLGIDDFWASQDNQAQALQNKAGKAYEETGKMPVGIYTTMGSEVGNYSLHNLDVALKMLYNKNPNDEQMNAFNEIMHRGTKTYGSFPEFVGLQYPELLRRQLEANPEMRKLFIDRLETPKAVQGLDLPEGLAIRHAITEPQLMDVPTGMSGFTAGIIDPTEELRPNISSTTYNTDVPGNYLGRMQLQLPWQKYFPKHAKQIAENPKQANNAYGTMQGLKTYETLEPETVDELMRMYEMIKGNSFKDGGQVQNFDKGGKADDVSVELMGDINYQPDPTYTDPMGMTVPSQDEMKLALSKQNMSPMPYPEPYRDPITGAILENGLEALPPGFNVPKSGGMTPIDWDNLPEEEKERTFGDYVSGVVEPATTLGTGMLSFMGGLPYAMGKGIVTGANAEDTLKNIMEQGTYIPRSKMGMENLETIGKAVEGLPPILPELHGLEPIISSATRRGLQLGAKGVKEGVKATKGLPVGMSIKDVSPSVTIEPFSPKDEFGFYSKLEKEAQKIQRKQGNGQAFKNDLLKLGVKPHELEDTGMDEFLKNNKNLTRDDVIGFAQRNRPVMKEIEFSDSWSNKLPKFEDRFRTPGGNDYHELLIQLPQKDIVKGQLLDDMARRLGAKNFESLPMEKRHEVARLAKSNPFTESNHFPDEENIMAILRMDSRTDTEGKRGMLLDELQSDWHQKGREQGYIPKNPTSLKGEIVEVPSITFKAGTMERSPPTYKVKWEDGTIYGASTKEQAEKLLNKGKPNIPKGTVPDAPYKDNWYELGLKKAIQHMVTSTGDDRLYLPKGQTVADRYSLSKHINSISYKPSNDPTYKNNLDEPYYYVLAKGKNNQNVFQKQLAQSELSEYVGKDLAKKIIANDGEQSPKSSDTKIFQGLDLNIGGEGMHEWYDKKYLSYLKDFAKKYGGHVGETEIDVGHNMPISEKLKILRMTEDDFNNLSKKEIQELYDKPMTQKVYYYEPSEEAIIKINGGLPYKNGGVVRMAEGGMAIESPPQFGVLPKTFPSIEGEEAEAIRRRLANTSAMNLANENYTKGLNTINVKTPEDQDYANSIPSSQVGGYYDTKKGNEIVINPVLSNINDYKTLPQVVGHEAQHLQDEQSLRGKQNVLDRLRMEGLQSQIEKNFQKVKAKYPEYANVGYYDKENVPFKERLADLGGYEAILPKGTRLVDTPFGKEVFNTPSLQNYYHASVRPMEQKMMPQTPSVMERNPVIAMAQQLKDLSKPKLDEFKARLATGDSYADALYKTITSAKFADGGSVESDPRFPIQAHVRNFQSPDLLDIKDYGITARDNGDAFTLGRQLISKNAENENPNMRFNTSQDYAQYATPMHRGMLNARVMKNPEQPSVQAMLQYMQEMGGGTGGIGLMGNRTSEGDKLRALQMIYNKQLSDTSDISGMVSLPFGDKPQFNVQYRKRFAEGGSVAETELAKMREIIDNLPKRTPVQTNNERLERDTIRLPYQPPKASSSVGLQPIPRGGSRIPSTQLELYKKKGGNVSIDEMQLALLRKK